MILVGLIVARQVEAARAYAAAGFFAVLALSITGTATDRRPALALRPLRTAFDHPVQFLDDPRWIAMLGGMLTVSGPWLPAR